jgi:hypothetical protein
VQAHLRERKIKFTAFKNSKSKAKFAEGAIRLVRTLEARLECKYNAGPTAKRGILRRPLRRWWNLLGEIATILNRQEIVVGNRRTGFAPEDVYSENVNLFLEALYKAAPEYRSSQFAIDPRHAVFKFLEGDYVRAKLIVTSSAVLGEKRSETNLTDSVFKMAKSYPVVTRNSKMGNEYLCLDTRSGEEAKFAESDLVLTELSLTTSDHHHPAASASVSVGDAPLPGSSGLGLRSGR